MVKIFSITIDPHSIFLVTVQMASNPSNSLDMFDELTRALVAIGNVQ